MVTTLFLIRHGETEGAEIKRYKGSIDVPLSEKGQKQMEQVAEFLNRSYKSYETYSLNAVYCSPLSRALKSAEIIAAPYGLKPIAMKDLRERSFGIWEGMSFTEIKEQYPEEFNLWASNPLKFSPVDGESTIELRGRVIDTFEKIIDAHNDEDIAIVAHGGVNRVILCHIMGIPLENIFRIEQDFAAVNIIEFHENYPVVKLLNGGCIG
ncbi:MAG: alpha-ribazole phosphatase [Nitrospirae bacterium]|nr:MAG: alpha-ribazole phosphatase [Nitrospirota bacterium]